MTTRMRAGLSALCLVAGFAAVPALADGPSFGISLYGAPKYTTASPHFDWANPDAPKGGLLKLEGFGTFDTLNPFIVKGVSPAAEIDFFAGNGMPYTYLLAPPMAYLYTPLMFQSLDEPLAEYGLIAETAELAPDRTWILFQLRKEAVFSDGSPITPDDVIWSFQTLNRPGMPIYPASFTNVATVEKIGERGVKFTFKDGHDRALPLRVGQLPVLSRAYWTKHDIDKTTLEPPVGNGPYEIEAIDPGRSITYRRAKNWWGNKLNIMRGLNNFDQVRIDFYRDETVALEAFKAGNYNFRQEQSSKDWAIGYEGPGLASRQYLKQAIPNGNPQFMQGYVLNTRRELFADRRVRQALGYLFDFEWANKTLFYGAYTRSTSYWNASDLASSGIPAGAELALLEKYRGKLPDDIFTTEYKPPVSDGSGNVRDGLREALKLFKAAGWSLKNGQLINDATGKPFEFEILLYQAAFERITLPYAQNLQRAGITAHVRTIDTSQYTNRVQNFDFDSIVGNWGDSAAPGGEQQENWGSEAADRPGSFNYAGIKNPVVDDLIEELTKVTDYEQLKTVVHALDRVLLNGYYLVPQWYVASSRVAYWNMLQHPAVTPKYAPDFPDCWWMTPGMDAIAAKPAQ